MNINAANAGLRPHFQPSRVEPATEPLPAGTGTEEPTADSPKSGEARGVIRLLQEGHFKGVADVRLRINFQEEISQLNSAAASAAAAEASESFTSGVSEDLATLITALAAEEPVAVTEPEVTQEQAEVTELAATEEQTLTAADLAAGFEASLADLLNELSTNEEADFAALKTALHSEAENFIGELQVKLELDPEDPLLTEFAVAFAERLDQLDSSSGSVTNVLPELSEPNGNGAAYAKFVAILDGMSNAVPDPELQEVYA